MRDICTAGAFFEIAAVAFTFPLIRKPAETAGIAMPGVSRNALLAPGTAAPDGKLLATD